MKSHPYPITLETLAELADPDEFSELHRPGRRDGLVYVGNGYLAARVKKGAWVDEEIRELGAKAAKRFDSLPWGGLDRALADAGAWRDLATVGGCLRRRGIIHPWQDNHVLAPTPVWKVAKAYVCLSMLQLVAKLPRAAVYINHTRESGPLYFKFNGGEGILAPLRKRPTSAGFELFKPKYDHLTGEELGIRDLSPRKVARSIKQTRPNWPPIDYSDA